MKRVWQIGNILALSFALAANYLVGAQVLGLPSIGEISDRYSTFLTPAGYAFSIWSLIYILLIGFVIYQARDIVKPSKDNKLPQLIGPLFIIASIFNGLWTYIFVSEFVGLSVVVLLALTVTLYVILWRLRIAIDNPPIKVILFVWWPMMIYAGWVTAASVVNFASWIDSLGFTVGPVLAVTMLIALIAFLLFLLAKRNARELVLASAWGVVAIGVRQVQQSEISGVAIVSFIAAGVLLAVVAIHAYINRYENLLSIFSKKANS